MDTARTPPGSKLFSEPGYFLIPNEAIDLHLADLGTEGLAVYCLLARCSTARHYPSVEDISGLLGRVGRPMPARRVVRHLATLHERGLLSDFDLSVIEAASERRNAELEEQD